MPITKQETPEILSSYMLVFDGNVTYDYHIMTLQRQLEAVRNARVRYVVVDFRQTVFVNPRLLNYLWHFRRELVQGHKLYFVGDRYKIDRLFQKTLSWEGRKRLLIRPDLETLVKELQ